LTDYNYSCFYKSSAICKINPVFFITFYCPEKPGFFELVRGKIKEGYRLSGHRQQVKTKNQGDMGRGKD
jgi:hypothetical protein